jgi:hypothetical protein
MPALLKKKRPEIKQWCLLVTGRNPVHQRACPEPEGDAVTHEPTTSWTNDELSAIGRAEELELASLRTDGTLRPYVTMWVVRSGDDLYVRSARGPAGRWYVHALHARAGRIRAGGLERDVIFADPALDVHAGIDAAYHAKYDRYGPAVVGTVVGQSASRVTIRLLPRD